MSRNLGRREGHTWDKRWSLPGDSIASLLLRLSRANVLSGDRLRVLFGNSAYLSEEGGDFSSPRLCVLDWGRLGDQLHLPLEFVERARLLDVLGELQWSEVCSRRFRYCPHCLAFGYHARFFQIAALAECPMHGAPLLEQCTNCKSPTASYGLSAGLFKHAYCCVRCSLPLAGRLPTLKDYRDATIDAVVLETLWAPFERWIKGLQHLHLSFAHVREWKRDLRWTAEPTRAVDSMQIIGAVHPLPKQYVWLPTSVERKALPLLVDDVPRKRVTLDSGTPASRYHSTRRHIERNYLRTNLQVLLQRSYDMGWYVLDPARNAELHVPDAAYILWRMHCENFGDPTLLKGTEDRRSVSVSDEMLPCAHWDLSPTAWTTVYRGLYRGIEIDVREQLERQEPIADLTRISPARQSCVLPSIDLHRRRTGFVVYPVLRSEPSPR